MKAIKFILVGIAFGIVMTKSEAISWYRIQEMFRFQSFHMYGIMGTAVITGVTGVALIKKFKIKTIYKEPIYFTKKERSLWRYLLGGTAFGLGWAITGACPGPMFVNFGNGYLSFAIVIMSAVVGTFIYGVLKEKLPH